MSRSYQKEVRFNKKWTRSEDLLLLRQVQLRPQNLHKCFVIVAEELGRTESAVSGRWYQHVSRDPANLCFFTASSKHVSKNRKNAEGDPCSTSIWKKLLNIIRNI